MNTQTPPEDHFEDRLLHAILDDFDDLTGRPAASRLARFRATQGSRPVRRAAPALVAGAAAVALGVAGAAALASQGPSGPDRSSTPPAPFAGSPDPAGGAAPGAHLPIRTAAYVVARTQAALAGGDGYVLCTEDHAPDSQTGQPVWDRIWAIPGGDMSRIETLDASGQPVSGSVVTTTDRSTTSVLIDYTARTWSETSGPAPSSSGPAPLAQTPAQGAAVLRADLADGTATLVGPATIDGRSTVELREGSPQAGQQDIWVDATTYLPVRVIDTAPGVAEDSDQAIRDDYQWLPATAANQRLVTAAAAIPAGFTQVAPPAGQ